MVPRRDDGWFKSSRSPDNANFVEMKLGARVGVRDTKARNAGALHVPASGRVALVATLKD